jgi:hypothetical protein
LIKVRTGKCAMLSAMIFILWALLSAAAFCEEIPTVPWGKLSDKDISPQARAALAIKPDTWKHAESEHFVYHFIDEKEAETVYVHAEYYYKYIKDFFEIAEDRWTKKNHIFIFSDEDVWNEFKKKTHYKLSWAGGYSTGWELYMFRRPMWLAARATLAHELSHVIAFRFMEGPLPSFLDEGFACFISARVLGTQLQRDDREANPLRLLPPGDYIPLVKLSEATQYPEDAKDAHIFYNESELLVRFIAYNYKSVDLYKFLHGISKGEDLKKTIENVFSIDFYAFEDKFKSFAVIK